MRITIPFVASLLMLAAVAAACTLLGNQSARKGGVYLVGVAGGGGSANAKVRAAFESIDGVAASPTTARWRP